MKGLLIILLLCCFSCKKQYECAELKRDPNGGFKDDTLHIWFIYSNNQYYELMDSSRNGQYRCSKTEHLKYKKTKYQ